MNAGYMIGHDNEVVNVDIISDCCCVFPLYCCYFIKSIGLQFPDFNVSKQAFYIL